VAPSDVVVEIGPGEGIITRELAKVARRIIAIEMDVALAMNLKKKMKDQPHVEIYAGDFLQFDVPESTYKIFSNIPFNRTADIVRRILNSEQVKEAYIIVQKEAGEKYGGTPRETEVSVLNKPWVSTEIIHQFSATDFEPVPSTDTVMLVLRRRENPLVPEHQKEFYRRFIHHGFHAPKSNLALSFKKVFTYEQWKRLARNLNFPIKVTASALGFEQWLRLFQYFMTGVAQEKKLAAGFITREEFRANGK
jgi:23S rRNA (adenine-N6)-dimethyltransferase